MADKHKAFVKVSRNILQWQWFKKPNHLAVLMYLLVTANYRDGMVAGIPVKRGDVVTSYAAIAQNTGISIQNARTTINHLKSTGEITCRSYHDFSVIKLVNYDTYQGRQQAKPHQTNKQLTSN